MADSDKEIERIEKGDAWDESDEVVQLEVKKPLDKVIPIRLAAEKWEELRVVLVGGGGALLARRSRAFILEQDGHWPMPQSYLRFNLPSYASPEPGGAEHKTEDGMLMQVAIGLARPGPDIVHFYRPHEVSDYPRAATYEYPTRDALGYGDK